MGLLSYIFGGGNIGMIAKSLAYHHNRLGSFDEVLSFYFSDFKSRASDSRRFEKAMHAEELIEQRKIKNYRDLAILALFVDAAPLSHDFGELERNFGKELVKYLSKHGISMDLIIGDALNESNPSE